MSSNDKLLPFADSKREHGNDLSQQIMKEWIETNEWMPFEHPEDIVFGELSKEEEEYWTAPREKSCEES